MKAGAMYRKAAKMMEDKANYYQSPVKFACFALELAEFGRPIHGHSAYCAPMKDWFAPDNDFGAWLSAPELSDQERNDVRILALCFMAELAERP